MIQLSQQMTENNLRASGRQQENLTSANVTYQQNAI